VRAETLAVLNESLTTIGRHAQSGAATIHVTALDNQLRLIVRANGIGSTAVDPSGDFRRDIQHRAKQLGGHGTIRSAGDDGGTIVEWVVPVTSDRN
jgi:signal transduction histidine kinase